MDENQIASIIVDSCIKIHKQLGPGLLESVYESVLSHELAKHGLIIERQVPIPLVWDGIVIAESFRADIIVNRKLIIELKSVEKTITVFRKQLLTYLRIADCKLGLLINFGAELMKDGIERIINGKL